MLSKARYRIVIYLLVIACAYTALSVLAGPSSPPWHSVRVRPVVVVDSLDATTYRVVDTSNEENIEGIVVAQVLIQIIESPIYFADEFEALKFNGVRRIEIGKRIETRFGVTSYYPADQLRIDLSEAESPQFVQTSIREADTDAQLTPTMKNIIVENASTQGRLINYTRATLALIAYLLYAAAIFAMLIELILAYFRAKRHRHQYQNNLCFQCSYQLTRDMNRCPECGQSVSWRAYALRR